jgi:hypothetical protein
MKTLTPSVNTKFAVHWPVPAVRVCTPGWMAAPAAGAQVGAAETAEVATVLNPPRAARATVATPAKWLSLRNTDKEFLHDQVMVGVCPRRFCG